MSLSAPVSAPKTKAQQSPGIVASQRSAAGSKGMKGKGRAVHPPTGEGTASTASASELGGSNSADKGKGRAASPRVASGSGSTRPSSESASRAATINGYEHLVRSYVVYIFIFVSY